MDEILFLPPPKNPLPETSGVKKRAFLLSFFTFVLGSVLFLSFSSRTEILANIAIQDPSNSEATKHQFELIEQKNHSLVRIMVDQKDYGFMTVKELGLSLMMENPDKRESHFFYQTSSAQDLTTSSLKVSLESSAWNAFLKNLQSTYERPSLRPQIVWEKERGWIKKQGQTGVMIVQSDIKEKLSRLALDAHNDVSPLMLELQTAPKRELSSPSEKRKLQQAFNAIEKLTAQPIVLHLGKESFELNLNSEKAFIEVTEDSARVNESRLKSWIDDFISKNSRPASKVQIVGKEEIRPGIFKAVLDGEFKEGLRMNADELLKQILSALENGEYVVNVKTYEIPVKVYSVLEEADYQLLSVGYSEFSTGNAPNRVHNVKTGLDRVNGTLVSPGQEISFNKSVGNINNDFRIGYGIYGTVALPVLGGGICQASTTFYRALLNLGVPIHQRQNHSWDLSYYQVGGYGLDATIYPEKNLDVKAVNDLNSDLLFYSYIRPETEEAFVLVYGKGDGRKVTLTPEKEYVPFKGPKTLKWKQTVEMSTGEIREHEIVSRYRS